MRGRSVDYHRCARPEGGDQEDPAFERCGNHTQTDRQREETENQGGEREKLAGVPGGVKPKEKKIFSHPAGKLRATIRHDIPKESDAAGRHDWSLARLSPVWIAVG